MRSLFLLLLLAGCGGGGDSAPAPQPSPVAVVEAPAPIQAATPVQAPAALPTAANSEGWSAPAIIIKPTQDWEFTAQSKLGSVFEPTVLYSQGVYTMWYSGGWDKCATGTATSLDGVTWTKNPANPLIGQGKMGRNIACRNSVLRINGETYVYFVSNVGDKAAIYVTHSADGVTGLSDPQVFLQSGTWDSEVANSWATVNPDGTIRFFYDSLTQDGSWQAFSARCDTPLGPCYKDPLPLKGLQTGIGSYGGGWARYVDGRWDTYYLAGPNGVEGGHVPSYLYHACNASSDKVAFGNGGHPLFDLPAGFDQHGDPFVLDGDNARLYFDEVNNPIGYAHIVMSSRGGSLASVSCP